MTKKSRCLTPIILLTILMISLAGCKDIDDDLASQKDVMKKVKESVTDEKYEFISLDHDTISRPKVDTYHFKSLERELRFDAISTLSPIMIDASTAGYQDSISVTYPQAVKNLYRNQIEAILAQFKIDSYNRYVYHSYDDIENIVKSLVAVDQVWRQELSYNSAEWLEKNHYASFRFAYQYEGAEEKDSLQTFSVTINGSLDYESLYDEMTYEHVKACSKSKVKDPTIPEEAYSRIHPDDLSIVIQLEDITSNAYQEAKEVNLNNNTESAYYAQYSYDLDTYIIPLDCGLTNDEYAPKLLQAYCKAIGTECEIKWRKGEISWQAADGNIWTLEAEQSARNHEITEVEATCNGEKEKISYVISGEKNIFWGPMYVIGLPLDEFARMFGLNYEIVESSGYILFRKNMNFNN